MEHIQLVESHFGCLVHTQGKGRAPMSAHRQYHCRGTGLFPFVGVAGTERIALGSGELDQLQVRHLRLLLPVAGYQSLDSRVEAVNKHRAAFLWGVV